MKKLIILVFAVLFISSVSFAADSLQTQCNALIAWTKGTKVEQLAKDICKTVLGAKTQTATTTKIIKRKKIGAMSRSDTAITKEQVQSIIANSVIKGNAKARFLIIEHSDLQCPFCKRQWDNKTIDAVIAKYNGKVASAFRNFPLTFHENALSWAYALECVTLQDKTKYYDFIGWVFWRGLNSETDLYKAAESLNLDTKRLKDCMATTTVQIIINKQIEDWVNLFGITGTPGNVILDTVTWKYKTIMGAYPMSEFEGILDPIAK